MKNLIKVIAIAFVMTLGVNTAMAQNLSEDQDRPEVVAKSKVADISAKLGLSGDQQRAMFRSYVAYEVSYSKNVKDKDMTDPNVIAEKNKAQETLKTAMKKTLDAKQFERWLAMQKS